MRDHSVAVRWVSRRISWVTSGARDLEHGSSTVKPLDHSMNPSGSDMSS